MDARTHFRTQLVGALPAIVHYFDQLGLAATIDELVPWEGEIPLGTLVEVLVANRLLQPKAVFRIGTWARSAALIYGWRFATLAPLRMLWGNLVNFAATATALWEFFDSQRRGKGLSWRKTEHVYPASVPALATGGLGYRQIPMDQSFANVSSSAAARESG